MKKLKEKRYEKQTSDSKISLYKKNPIRERVGKLGYSKEMGLENKS